MPDNYSVSNYQKIAPKPPAAAQTGATSTSNQRLPQAQRQLAPNPRSCGTTSSHIRSTSSTQRLQDAAPNKSGSSSKGKEVAVDSSGEQIKALVRQARKIRSDASIASEPKHEALLSTYANIISINSREPSGWINLANELSDHETIPINGMSFDKKMCLINFLDFTRTLKLKDSSEEIGEVYALVAKLMLPNETVEIRGQALSRSQVLSQALNIKCNSKMFVSSGLLLDEGETLEFNNKRLDRTDCLIEGIKKDKSYFKHLLKVEFLFENELPNREKQKITNELICLLAVTQLIPQDAKPYLLIKLTMMADGVLKFNNQTANYYMSQAYNLLEAQKNSSANREPSMGKILHALGEFTLPPIFLNQ